MFLPDEGQFQQRENWQQWEPPLAVFQKGTVWGFKEQLGRGWSGHSSLWLAVGPPQMWTVGSLAGISESVLEPRQSKEEPMGLL